MTQREDRSLLWPTVRGPIWVSLFLALGFFLGLGGWAAYAPLSSAAVAPGYIGVETRRKTVQHLEGGIIAELHVSEGDRVAVGDLLMRLDDTMAQSTFDLLEGQFIDRVVEKVRLEAELEKADAFELPKILDDAVNKERIMQAMKAQSDLFSSRREALSSRTEILRQKSERLQQQILGLRAQETATRERIRLLEQEEAAVKKLVDRGLEREPRLLALRRTAAELDGHLGDLASRIAQAQVLRGETELEIVDLWSRTRNQIYGDLRDLSGRIADMEPRLRAAKNTLARVEVRAPEDGTVVRLRYHTVGGVIRPGEPILDLVPAAAAYLVEAQISPRDIDVVRVGLTAEIRLTAFSSRTTPTLAGEVVHVSADRLSDGTGQGRYYYAVHVSFDTADYELTEPGWNGALYPGMPVEVMIVTGQQPALGYFLQPITDAVARAFRES